MVVDDRLMVHADATASNAVEPYDPGWLDRLIAGIHRLPGPAWAAYAGLAAASVVLSVSQAWASDQLPAGQLRPDLVYWGVFLVALIWVVDHLGAVAKASFDAFRPALDVDDPEAAALRYRLLVMPSRWTWAITVFTFVITPLYYILDPATAQVSGLSPAGLVLRGASEALSSTILLIIVFQLLRQLRAVDRIVATAPRVDLFQPGPLYAFSRLTSRTAIALVVLLGTSTLVAAPTELSLSSVLLWGPWIVGIPLFAVAAFVLPLRGMHDRLVAEKRRLQSETELRLKHLLAEVDRDVDARDLSRADGLNKSLSTLLLERDVIGRLPTWPWSLGTLGGVVSTIFLPLVVFLLQRFVSQFI